MSMAVEQRPKGSGLKILFVTADRFPIWRVDVSVLFGQEMADRGHQIDFVLPAAADCHEHGELVRNANKHWVSWNGRLGGSVRQALFHLFRVLNDLRCLLLLKRERYELVVIKDKFFTGFLVLLIARLRGVKAVYWLSWPFPEQYLDQASQASGFRALAYRLRGRLSQQLLYTQLLRSVSHVFVQSHQMMLDVEAHGISREKMTVVPMGVDRSLLDETVDDVEVQTTAGGRGLSEQPTVLYLGAMDSYRRLDMLLEAMQYVLKKDVRVQLVMVGDSPKAGDLERLKQAAVDLGVDSSVRFTGRLERAQAMQEVRRSWVCLSPFYPTPVLNSTSPTKLIEYMAMGKPVVVNDHPEQSLVVRESSAGLSVPWCPRSFGDAILRLIADPEESARIGQLGRTYVRANRTYRTIADLVERKFLEISQCP